MKRTILFAAAALLLLAAGCVRVHQVDRGTLSSRVMQFEPMGAADFCFQKNPNLNF